MKKEVSNDSRMWRWLVNIWTLILFFFIIADFFRDENINQFLGPVAAIYVAALAIYSADKEFERWRLYSIGRHPGEMYVVAWTVIIIVLFLCAFVGQSGYTMPPEIFSTYIVVLGILAITRRSKTLFNERVS